MYKSWRGVLGVTLGSYGVNLSGLLEAKSVMDGAPFDRAMALAAFVAVYTSEMIGFANSQMMESSRVPFTALGVAIGCKDHALRLAHLQLAAFRKGRYLDKDGRDTLSTKFYPAHHCMMRILADYLGEPQHVLAGESLTEPYGGVNNQPQQLMFSSGFGEFHVEQELAVNLNRRPKPE
jgi:hypothetical protein